MSLDQTVVELALGQEASASYSQGEIPKKLLEELVPALKELSGWYVSKRDKYFALKEDHVRAYLIYYLLINNLKWDWLWKRTAKYLEKDQPLKVLDFGSGPGTASISALSTSLKIEKLALIEQSREMRDYARQLLQNLKAPEFEIFASLPEQIEAQDLIVCSHVLNELSPEALRQTLNKFHKILKPLGVLAIMETALQAVTRDLMSTRDYLLTEYKDLQVVFPCTHQIPCPMLKASQTDWCHTSLTLELPGIIKQLDRLTEFNKHRIKFSCLVLKKTSSLNSSKNALRLMEDVRRQKYGFEALVCSENFYGKKIVKKDAKEKEEFARLKSFDLL